MANSDLIEKGLLSRVLPALIIGVAIVLFGRSLERAAQHIGEGLDDFGLPITGWLHKGSDVDFPRTLTIRIEDAKGK